MPDSSMLPARRRTLLIATSLMTLIIAAALLIHSHRQLQALEDRHIELIGQSLSRQLAQSSLPLVLSQDWVSLNYSLQQASEDVHVAGARIEDTQGKVLAQVGQSNDSSFRQPLASGEQQLAQLSLFLDRQSLAQSLVKQRNSVPAAILLGLASLLLGYWLTLRWLDKHPPKPVRTGARTDSPDHPSSSPHSSSPHSSSPHSSYLHSAYNPNPADDNSGRQAPAEAEAVTDLQTEAALASEFKFRPDPALLDEVGGDWHQAHDETQEEQETDLLAEPLNADLSAPATEPEAELNADAPAAAESSSAGAESTQRIDPFARFAATYNPGDKPESVPESEPAPARQSSAALGQYLLYVDHRSAGHHLEDEKAALLPHYLQFFQLASQLYKGEQREDAQGNWYALFTWDTSTADEQVPAGVSALCAAQLFKSLYRQFNQSRIQSLQPVLNLKMALLGGDNELTLALHAHQLTAMLESNELISHQAVFEQPELFQRLLQEGDYSRQDQDTYLIHQLAAGFQNLIDRQATHFLQQKQAQPN